LADGETTGYIFKNDTKAGMGLWSAFGVVTAASKPSLAWSPDGGYFALTNNGANTVKVYRVVYVSGYNPQTFATGLVFGNSSLGSAYNANVRVLPGASVSLNGKVFDDSI
jgi:hypothetical protein